MSIKVEQQLVNTNGLAIIPHQQFNQGNIANKIGENMIINAVPISSFNPDHEQVEGSKEKKQRRASSEVDVEEKKDFSLMDLYKITNINELNLCKEIDVHEATLNPQELQKNLKGWYITKRVRVGPSGNVRTDQFYRHEILSKRKLRSLKEVKRCIEKNSYQRKDSDNPEGSKVEQINERSMVAANIDQVENHERLEDMVRDKKLPRKSKIVKCSKCHNQGHNSRTCKTQPATCHS